MRCLCMCLMYNAACFVCCGSFLQVRAIIAAGSVTGKPTEEKKKTMFLMRKKEPVRQTVRRVVSVCLATKHWQKTGASGI